MIGSSSAIDETRRSINRLAPRDTKVLITGETGTGKELVARSLWQLSKRRDKPFVVVNAAAIPEGLVESELFGHRKGAFTGAYNDQVGKIELARDGTLFLDEIGDLPPKAQSKLLRFLENQEIQRVGDASSQRFDVRLVAATSCKIEEAVKLRQFRQDLYFRINVGRIALVPLRLRMGDLPELFEYFLGVLCDHYGEVQPQVSPQALTLLHAHTWPGNIRELRNVAERCVLAGESPISTQTIELSIGCGEDLELGKSPGVLPNTQDQVVSLRDYCKMQEKLYIEAVLGVTRGNVSKAASLLCVDRSHLYQKASKLGIDLRQIKPSLTVGQV